MVVYHLIKPSGIVFAQDIPMAPISLLKKGGSLKSLEAKPSWPIGLRILCFLKLRMLHLVSIRLAIHCRSVVV